MSTTIAWGQDPTLIGGYALAEAETVVRLLLPPRTADGQPTTWQTVAAANDWPEPLDGYVSWHRLTELPGSGEPADRATFDHPAGQLSSKTLTALTVALRTIQADKSWIHDGLDDDAVATSLTAPDQPMAAAQHIPATHQSGTFATLSANWVRRGFTGRAWTQAGPVGIAAPAYADSLIISGPKKLRAILVGSELEVLPVDRKAHLPISTD